MYIMYANTTNNTPLYTHNISYVVWRVHPLVTTYHGQIWVILSIDLLDCILICHKPLRFTFGTLISAIKKATFSSQKSICVVPSLDCMSQCAVFNTSQHLLLYTWHVKVVHYFKHLTWSNKYSMSHLTFICFIRPTTLPGRSTNILSCDCLGNLHKVWYLVWLNVQSYMFLCLFTINVFLLLSKYFNIV